MKIEIRRLNTAAKSDVIALMNHPKVRSHLPLAKGKFDEEAYNDFIAAKEDLWKKHGYGPWAFFLKEKFIGWGGLQYEEGEADFALILHPDYWGFGKAIFDLTVRQAFGKMGFRSITALLPLSRLKLGVMGRLGFRRDGELMLHGQRFLRFRLKANADYVSRIFKKISNISSLPQTFVQNIRDIYDDDGQMWLDSLPQRLHHLENLWNIKLGHPMPNLTYSYVALAQTKNGPAVLKLAPKSDRLNREICWYQAQNTGCARLLSSDDEQGALLLEYLQPGVSLKQKVIDGQDDEATEIIAQVIVELNPPKVSDKSPFPHVSKLLKDLELLKGKIPDRLFSYSCELFHRLLEAKEDVILHGDLHHDNILSHGENYRAIDPHGYIGPQAFEVGAFLRNPYDCFPTYRSLEETISLRLGILYRLLPFSREEIKGWTLVYTLIAASWSVQDHGELPVEHLDIANVIRSNNEAY